MSTCFIDLTGRTFGRWTVLFRATPKGKPARWRCRCVCGVEKDVLGGHLRGGLANSCGCGERERRSTSHVTHGQSFGNGTRTYRIWGGMKSRCYNPQVPCYKDYGGRGRTICQRWLDSFDAFLSDMGECPSKAHTIDRTDNSKGYEPGNCKWATMQTQMRHTRHNRVVTVNGETHCTSEWAEINGISYSAIRQRLNDGWPEDKAVTLPNGSRLSRN